MRSTAGARLTTVREATSATSQRLDIQGLRAVAVLMVVCFHAGLPMPGGFVGVDVFFVISGFVITSMLRREQATHGRLRFGHFYARRFRRLGPALALVVGVTVVVAALVASPFQSQGNTARTGIGAMLLHANFAVADTTGGYFDAAADTNPLLHTWSLSVEEQFYLVFPLVLVLGWWLSSRFPRLRWGVVLLVGVIAAGSLLSALTDAEGFYSPFTRGWEFAAGALLALMGAAVLGTRTRAMAALGGIAMLASSLWVITGATKFPGVATFLPVTGALLLIAAGSKTDNVVSRALASRPFVVLGDRSYSWYLWHWPLIVFSGFLWPGSKLASVAAAIVSLGPASASYRWVEQPIRNLKRVSRRSMAMIVAVCVVPAIALCVSLSEAIDNHFWSPRLEALQAEIPPVHAAAVAGCSSGVKTLDTPRCTWNAAAVGRPIYLIGDSNAEQFSEATVGAGRRLERPAHISTFNGCAFVGASWSDASGAQQADCRRYVARTLAWLGGAQDGVVVLGLSDSIWESPNVAVGPTHSTQTLNHDARVRYLESDLRSVAARLRRAGHSVVLLQPIPKPWAMVNGEIKGLYDPTRCTTVAVLRGGCPKPVVTPLAEADRFQADARQTIQRVAQITDARVLDLRAFFCPRGLCSTHRGDRVLYRDGGHITVRVSRQLAPVFARAIRAL